MLIIKGMKHKGHGGGGGLAHILAAGLVAKLLQGHGNIVLWLGLCFCLWKG